MRKGLQQIIDRKGSRPHGILENVIITYLVYMHSLKSIEWRYQCVLHVIFYGDGVQ